MSTRGRPTGIRGLPCPPSSDYFSVVVEAAIFDIDGTLVDSVDLHAEAWWRALAAYGKDVPLIEVRAQIGKGGDQLLLALLSPTENRKFGAELEKHRGDLFRREYLPRVTPFPGVRPLFERLRRDGVRIALASSSTAEEVTAYKRIARITDLIDAETSADDVEQSKPHPDVFQETLKRLGATPNQAVAVGDTPYDVQAAVRAGVPVIGLLSGGFAREKLLGAGCRQIYQDIADLLAGYETSTFHNPLA